MTMTKMLVSSPMSFNTMFIKALTKLFSAIVLFTISACDTRSDIDKYFDMMRDAANSPITEKSCFEPFNFDMTEDEYNAAVQSLLIKDGESDYNITIGNNRVIGSISPEFHNDTLCQYYLFIDHDINNKLIPESTVNQIIQSINDIFKDGGKYYFYETRSQHLWSKGNLFVTLESDNEWFFMEDDYGYKITIDVENRPTVSEIEFEKRKNENESTNSRYDTGGNSSYAEVKNSAWDGSVKQVKEYLKNSYLRDPDSYESIEWSEVKRKDDGYYVRHKYRAKNGFGGYVVANQLFHLDFSGNVVDVKDLY